MALQAVSAVGTGVVEGAKKLAACADLSLTPLFKEHVLVADSETKPYTVTHTNSSALLESIFQAEEAGEWLGMSGTNVTKSEGVLQSVSYLYNYYMGKPQFNITDYKKALIIRCMEVDTLLTANVGLFLFERYDMIIDFFKEQGESKLIEDFDESITTYIICLVHDDSEEALDALRQFSPMIALFLRKTEDPVLPQQVSDRLNVGIEKLSTEEDLSHL